MSSSQPVEIRDVMTPKPIHIQESDSLALVMSLFERTHIGGAVVQNAEGKYVGVVSKTDFAGSRLLKHIPEAERIKIKEIMTARQLITVNVSDTLNKAVALMLEKQVHRVFVTDDEQNVVGVVSTFDVLRFIHEYFQEGGQFSKKAAVPAGGTPPSEESAVKKLAKEKALEERIFNLISQVEMTPRK